MSDPKKVKKEVEAWAVVYAFGEHSEIADSDSAALAVYEFEGTARRKIDSDSQRVVPGNHHLRGDPVKEYYKGEEFGLAPQAAPTLDELVSRITPENIHGVAPQAEAPTPTLCRSCKRPIFYSNMVHSWVHASFLPDYEDHQASPEVVGAEAPRGDQLYCDDCGAELQREACNHVRPCSECAQMRCAKALEANSAPSNIEQEAREWLDGKLQVAQGRNVLSNVAWVAAETNFNGCVEIAAEFLRHMLSKEKE